ncbi:MAG: DUF2147 domain-containing protein [Acidobacteriota bacterium]
MTSILSPIRARHLPRLVLLALLAGACLLLALPAAAQDADALVGTWLTAPSERGQVHVEITESGGTYSGKIVWMERPNIEDGADAGKPKTDRENPDKKLRDRPIIGLPLVTGFSYDGGGVWSGGKIYDPEKGKTYKCKITLRDDGALDVRGFVGFSMLGRTTRWTPVESAAPASAGN